MSHLTITNSSSSKPYELGHPQQQKASCNPNIGRIFSCAMQIVPTALSVANDIYRHFRPLREIQSKQLTDGTLEEGIFINGKLHQGIRTQNHTITYVRPQPLHYCNVYVENEGIELNFAEVTGRDGQPRLVPVQKNKWPYDDSYSPYTGSPCEALLKIGQRLEISHSEIHPLKEILLHGHNELVSVQEFLTFLCTPDQEGLYPIFTLTPDHLADVLELAIEKKIPLDLKKVDPKGLLFIQNTGSGRIRLTQALLQIDSIVIRQASPLIKAILEGCEKEAELLSNAIIQHKVELSLEEAWILRAFTNDCSFTREEFEKLPLNLRLDIYRIANVYLRMELIEKLRSLGLYEPASSPRRASIFSSNMDAITAESTLKDFLLNLRSQGRLLTQNEFNRRSGANFCRKPQGYVCKKNNFGRILGRDYIEREAKNLHVDHLIKVPNKIAVIEQEKSDPMLSFKISQKSGLHLECEDLRIYAEKITRIPRKATREEMEAIIQVVSATEFNDTIGGENFFMGKNQAGEEGVYFIDTEAETFGGHVNGVGDFFTIMDPKDHPWLEGELAKFHQRKEINRQEEFEKRQRELTLHGFADRTKPFTFPIETLLRKNQRNQ